MKRLLLLLLALALLLAACGESEKPAPMVQPVSLYYRTAKTDFSAEDGVIRAEIRDLGDGSYSEEEIIRLYFSGPKSEDLVSPVSQVTKFEVSLENGNLRIRLNWGENAPAEFDRTLACVCLAKTGLALKNVGRVQITDVGTGETADYVASDILLFDSSAAPESGGVTLYYADEEGVFLLTEKRSFSMTDPEKLPQQVLDRLLEKSPQNFGMSSPLPDGITMKIVGVAEGICSVNLMGSYHENWPGSEQAEQLFILSVVNTLCELDGIERVQFLFDGQMTASPGSLDFSTPWSPDTAPVGPIREELGEFAATLCLPAREEEEALLHRLTIRCRARSGVSREEALLQVLFARSAQNGLDAPLAGAPAPLSVSVENHSCVVSLAAGTLPAEDAARTRAVRSIVATLTSLPDILVVSIKEDGEAVTPSPLSAADSWFRVAPPQ